jgi:hypothetical protein
MPHPNGTLTYEELISVSKDELIQYIDTQLSLNRPDQLLRAQLYINELTRRDQDKSNRVMLDYTQEVHRFTRQMRTMTVVILVFTIVGVIVAISGIQQ